MTQQQIDRQIEAIRLVTKEALKSKEASRQLLIDAGIFLKDQKKREAPSKKK